MNTDTIDRSVLEAVIESSPDGMLLVNEKGQIVLANSEAERAFGHSRAELVGELIEMLIPPRFREGHRAKCEAFTTELLTRPVGFHADFLGLRKNGTQFPVEVGLRPIRLGEDCFTITTVRDVTERKRLESEFGMAQQIQQSMLPNEAPSLPGFDIAAASRPAEATGGDLFDYFWLPGGKFGLAIGDVSGHGFGPALLTASTHSYLRALMPLPIDESETLARMNQLLLQDTRSEQFVTLMFLRLDPETRSFDYVGAGHPDGYVLDSSGAVKQRLCSGFRPLGLLPDTTFGFDGLVSLEPGDLILLLTDGILETMSSQRELLGRDRVLEVVRRHRAESAQAIVDALFHAAAEFSRPCPQQDDITLMVIRVDEPRSNM